MTYHIQIAGVLLPDSATPPAPRVEPLAMEVFPPKRGYSQGGKCNINSMLGKILKYNF